jgi:hypothetical protein
VNLGLGGNVFATKTTLGGKETLYGGFGSCSIGKLTVFGELDYIRTSDAAAPTTGLVSYVEADYPVIQGIDLKLAYDFYDPDINVTSGSTSRYTVGLEFFPIQGVEVRPLYRFVRETPTESKNDEFDVVIHFYI